MVGKRGAKALRWKGQALRAGAVGSKKKTLGVRMKEGEKVSPKDWEQRMIDAWVKEHRPSAGAVPDCQPE
jgi:hypothetical protein